MLKESRKALMKYSLMVGLQTGCLLFELSVFSSEGMSLWLFLKNLGMGCRGTEFQLIATNYLESSLSLLSTHGCFAVLLRLYSSLCCRMLGGSGYVVGGSVLDTEVQQNCRSPWLGGRLCVGCCGRGYQACEGM